MPRGAEVMRWQEFIKTVVQISAGIGAFITLLFTGFVVWMSIELFRGTFSEGFISFEYLAIGILVWMNIVLLIMAMTEVLFIRFLENYQIFPHIRSIKIIKLFGRIALIALVGAIYFTLRGFLDYGNLLFLKVWG